MSQSIQKAWEDNTEHGYVLMLYIQKGWTMKEIANMMGCTKQFINNILKKNGVSGRYNGSGNIYEDEELLEILSIKIEESDEKYITYEAWNSEHAPPHAQTFVRRFGSWGNAINKACDILDKES